MSRPHKVLAKVVHLGLGLDLIGSKTTVSHKQADLEVGPLGVRMRSRKTKRVVLLPWSNIKGCELLQDEEDDERPMKESKRESKLDPKMDVPDMVMMDTMK